MMMYSSYEGGSRNSGSSKEEAGGAQDQKRRASPEKRSDGYENNAQRKSAKASGGEATTQEMLEAAARASLRAKFDHVGIDPHSSPDRDVRSIAENRGMTNSPPPPSLAMSAAPQNLALPHGHAGVGGFVRHHLAEQHADHHADHHAVARVHSPILFSAGNESPTHATSNIHLLQLHQAVALAGVSLGHVNSSPLDLMNLAGTRESADLEVSCCILLLRSFSTQKSAVLISFWTSEGGAWSVVSF
jgi:hypothetical protein